ncbi:MAG TPA: hypothetical protein VGX68_06835 [Thermoanaerobaculia bacterium]|nr:hypothetical protein [Thermoanaerobaculia bacterium]
MFAQHPKAKARRAAAEGAVLLALAGAAWLLYGSVLRLWWTGDDFFHLRFQLTHRPLWYIFDSAGYRDFPSRLLTPLLFLSLDLDRWLFGLEPRPFYVHQLLSLSLCPPALYAVLRLWLRRSWSAAGAWLFLIGPVTASLALVLAHHYVETLLLSALAVAAWAAALYRNGGRAWRWTWLSALLYFAACMAKEIAVPFVAVLPFLPVPAGAPQSGFRQRSRLAMPHAAAALLYLGLRYAVLGTPFGGYGFIASGSSLPRLALELPGKIAAQIVGGRLSPAAVLFGAVLAVGILALLLMRGWKATALFAFALILAALPALPVSTRMEPRYALPAWLVVAVAFAAGCRTLAAARRRTGAALALAACASGLWLNRQDWAVRFARVERMSAENRFLLEMRKEDVLRHPLTLAASLRELAWMKEAVFHRPPGGGWFQDDLYLCVHRGRLGRVWGYDEASHRIVDLAPSIPALRARHCSSIRRAPLKASFRFAGEDLFWNLGPYDDGRYRFVLADGAEAYDMPRRAGFKVGRLDVLPLRIEYVSPAGWVTYSPELRLREGASLRWARP